MYDGYDYHCCSYIFISLFIYIYLSIFLSIIYLLIYLSISLLCPYKISLFIYIQVLKPLGFVIISSEALPEVMLHKHHERMVKTTENYGLISNITYGMNPLMVI